MIQTRPPPLPSREAQARHERIDLFLLIGQGIACLVLGAWAGEAATPRLAGAAWIGAGLLALALAGGHGMARLLVATVLAPWAVMQLMQRARDPKARQPATQASDARLGLVLNAVAIMVLISFALAAAVALAWFAKSADLFGALWRFGLAAIVLSLPLPRAIRALA